MTRDEIIRMARKACPNTKLAVIDNDDLVLLYLDEFERFAALVAAAEREECAKVCEEHWRNNGNAMECVDAIRARGEK